MPRIQDDVSTTSVEMGRWNGHHASYNTLKQNLYRWRFYALSGLFGKPIIILMEPNARPDVKPAIGEGKGEHLRGEFRKIYQTLEEVPRETHQQPGQFYRKDEVDRRFAKVESELNILITISRNSKISHLAQRIHAIPAYDEVTQHPLPIPGYFPLRALAFYRLQDEKNRKKLSGLLRYYQLASDVIHLSNNSDGYFSEPGSEDSGSGSNKQYTEEKLIQAIDLSPWGALSVLASHLGIDLDGLNERVALLQFQRDSQATKRVAEEPLEPMNTVDPKRRFINGSLNDKSTLDAPPPQTIVSEGKQTSLNWEHDSEKFINQLPVHRLRDERRSSVAPTETQEASEEGESLSETSSDDSPTPTEIIPSAQLNPQLKKQRSAG